MKKRNCRKTDVERAQHDRAIRIRKMTDSQLCDYLDSLERGRQNAYPSKEEIVESFLNVITIRREDGLRVSDATVRKLRSIAEREGFIHSTGEVCG